jgi:hypothetical protein
MIAIGHKSKMLPIGTPKEALNKGMDHGTLSTLVR